MRFTIQRRVRGIRRVGPSRLGGPCGRCDGRSHLTAWSAKFDRFGHDANGLSLIVVAGPRSDFVALMRETGRLDRQGKVVDLVVASLVRLRIRAFVRG